MCICSLLYCLTPMKKDKHGHTPPNNTIPASLYIYLPFSILLTICLSILEQGSTGIRQWPINWCTSPNDKKQDYKFCRLNLVVETFEQLNALTNQNTLKSPKLLSQRMRKFYYKTLGTSVIKNLFSPLFLCFLSLFPGRTGTIGCLLH